MKKIPAFIAIAALTAALPQLALAQSSAPTQQPSGNQTSIRQQVKDNLAQAGFTNIRVMPESFLVRATDKDGNPVMMVINPDSMTEITGMSSQGNANSAEQEGQSVSKSAKMTDQQTNSGRAEQNEENQASSQSAKMNDNVPGHQGGMVTELKQDESQGLNLSTTQRSAIWNQLGHIQAQQAPSGFTPQVGETAPNDMQLQAVPGKLSRQVPLVKSYRYAKLSDGILLVDPSSKKIVAIVTE